MLDQAQYNLFTGDSSLDCLSLGDFGLELDVMQQRLMLALCLTETPDELLWDKLLADALNVSLTVKTNDGIKSENMRNYSYSLSDFANTWEMLTIKSGDLLNRFNACPSGVTFQTDIADRIYGDDYYYYCDGEES
jgi:hypothetical protein